ncbi:MAG TPA: restriction endonuclease subunit S [Caulobacteraceae bacterium]
MSWPVAALGDLFDVARGGSPRPIDNYLTDSPDGVNWVSISDATDSTKYIEKTKRKITRAGVSRSRTVTPGDFLLTNSMSFGRPYIMATSGCIHDGWLALSPRTDRTDRDYLFHILGSPATYRKFERLASGATVKNLNIDLVRSVEIPLPPLDEQRRIAAILDQANELRRKRREVSDRLNTLISATFLDFFGDPVSNACRWPVSRLGDVGTLDRGVSKHRPRNDPALLGGRYPLIQTGDVANSGGAIRSYKSTYSDFGLRQSRLWPRGTLCITIAANIGKTGILDFDACFPDSVVGFSPGPDVTAHYVQTWMSFIQEKLENDAPESAQKNINLEILRNLEIPIPTRRAQDGFDQLVMETTRLAAKNGEGLSTLDALFASLQHRAFAGEL